MHGKHIRFKDLSTPLKIATLSAWTYATILAITFITEIIIGTLEYP